MSPEYAVFGKFSTKSDVFSFGVITLEIITGKKNNGFHQMNTSLSLIGHVSEGHFLELIVPSYIIYQNSSLPMLMPRIIQVWDLWREDRALEIVDSSLEGSYSSHEVLRIIQIGLLCVQEKAEDRPTMLEVVLMLSSEAPLPAPKQPPFVFTTSCSTTSSLGVGEEGSSSINEETITEAY